MVKRKLGALEKVEADLYVYLVWTDAPMINRSEASVRDANIFFFAICRPNLQHKIRRDPK